MIKEIEIRNFRSIQSVQIPLSPLTVIVGANSTGKSNLVKAIDFLSDVAEVGLQESVYKRGGFDEILPKQYKSLNNNEIYFKINFDLEPPKRWIKLGLPSLSVTYELGFTKRPRNKIKITKESLELNSLLLLSKFIENDLEKSSKNFALDDLEIEKLANSSIKIFRDSRDTIQYKLGFSLESNNLDLFVAWLGLGTFIDKDRRSVLGEKGIEKLFKNILNTIRPGQKKSESLIITSDRALISFNNHLRKLREELISFGRYDLLINELRQEQSISDQKQVSLTGDNIPSVVKNFVSENASGWQRILTTMSNISPYFSDVNSKSLRAGKEYLVFKEIFNGRKVESWEASDGTLRALAILLSIEAHPDNSTIMIEEPEHGLHPWAVRELISHFRDSIEAKEIQIILTTHSQQVLELINKEELLISERDESGTKYLTINSIIDNMEVDMGEIGELWTRGLLKGVPTSKI
ncbi:AAA family ATPase [Rufibacter latericius]|uniref:DUF2813 domain-containing protein n=1 Tax=Rufibacter latericius TaxID=2487040 RepID=A0A3M9MTL3_9BACT|nr:AAA family ATPase [Rufibacter latericius]RNI28851.1 DUF2813 domain-containing protein [Rufibacter latericius]